MVRLNITIKDDGTMETETSGAIQAPQLALLALGAVSFAHESANTLIDQKLEPNPEELWSILMTGLSEGFEEAAKPWGYEGGGDA